MCESNHIISLPYDNGRCVAIRLFLDIATQDDNGAHKGPCRALEAAAGAVEARRRSGQVAAPAQINERGQLVFARGQVKDAMGPRRFGHLQAMDLHTAFHHGWRVLVGTGYLGGGFLPRPAPDASL